MAISRSLMSRQLQANGGIMQFAPREKFGIGSKIKRAVRKIIPNEVAEIAVKAAPFVAPFNPAAAAAMSGIGTFDQTGSIGDSLKRGALTYGGGQLARYVGGAGFQGNPFASGGAFTPSGFTAGFSSPIGVNTGLGKFFSNRGTQPIKSIASDGFTGSDVGGNITMAQSAGGTSASPKILAEQMSELSLTPQKIAETVTQETVTGSPARMSFMDSLKTILGPDSTMTERGTEALNLLKRGAKSAFTKTDAKGNTVPDKAAIMGALAFASSYAEAKALADEIGVDIGTEEEYDEATKAEKKEQYAADLQNFFGGKKDGGRIGFRDGTPDKIMEQFYESNDPDANKSTYTMEDFDITREPEVVLVSLQGPDGIKLEKMLKSDAIKYGLNIVADSFDTEDLEGETIDLSVLGKKDGGRIGFDQGTNTTFAMIRDMLNKGMDEDTILTITGASQEDIDSIKSERVKEAQGGRIGFKIGSKPEDAEIGIMTIDVEAGDDDEEDMDDLMAGTGINFSRQEKSYLFRRLGGAGGADRSYTMPNLYRILSNPSRYPEDARVLKQIAIMGLGKKDGGRIGFAFGSPDRKTDIEEELSVDTIYRPTDKPPMLEEMPGGDKMVGMGNVMKLFETPYGFDRDRFESMMLEFKDYKQGGGGLGLYDFTIQFLDMVKKDTPKSSITMAAKGGRIGYKGGANRVSELLILRDGILAKDANADVSDIEAELFQLTGKTFRSVGGIGDVPTGELRRNKAGVIERDYRDEGGFVPVGIKERADDVPAMLSKNEFVMTADAVRGIGGGDVEKGSQRLYKTMKQAEKVGKA